MLHNTNPELLAAIREGQKRETISAINELSRIAQEGKEGEDLDNLVRKITGQIDSSSLERVETSDLHALIAILKLFRDKVDPYFDADGSLGLDSLVNYAAIVLEKRSGDEKKENIYPPQPMRMEKELVEYWQNEEFCEMIRTFIRESNTFKDTLSKISPDIRNRQGVRGLVLILARDIGKLTGEFGRDVVDSVRSPVIEGRYYSSFIDANDHLFIETLRALSSSGKEKPDEEYQINFRKRAEIHQELIEMEKQRRLAGVVNPEGREKELLDEYCSIDSRLQRFMAAYFLHFYDSGDFKWLWGLTDDDTIQTAVRKSEGGRIGDHDDAEWF